LYKAIVVGTDGSDTAKRAVSEATRLAQALGATVHVVSAFEPVRGARIAGAPEGAAKIWAVAPDANVQAIVDGAAVSVRTDGVEVKTHTVTGDPADALVEVAEREHAELIVVGNQGMHGVRRVLGSVPTKVARRAGLGCSVLIVSTDPERDGTEAA